jgi:hypothetical protein
MTASTARLPAAPHHGGRTARLVWVLAAAAMVMIAVVSTTFPEEQADTSLLGKVAALSTVASLAAFVLCGSLIVSRQPGNVIGWLLILPGLAMPLAALVTGWLEELDPPTDVDPVVWLALWASSWSWIALIFPIFHLLLTFPTGRLPSPAWRWVVALEVLMMAVMVGLTAVGLELAVLRDDVVVWSVRNPIGFVDTGSWWATFSLPWTIGLIVVTVAGVSAVVTRFRRGSVVERQQLKVPVLGLGFFGLVYGFGAIQGTLDGPIADLAFGLSLAAIPISVAIAVLRYRLYEIDRVISRTIGWIVVTTMLAAFVGGAIIGLQALLAPFTSNNTLAVAVSTLLAAALFQPLRARVQRIVDRRFNRARVDAQQAVDAFGAHLRDDLELATLRDRLVSAAEAGVQPAGAGLWLRRRSGDAA